MTTTQHEPARLRFASSILARLGEELIPDPDQGLLELARNAYDAGATRCVIELVGADSAGGTVVVSDDGDGMTRDDIVNGFLVLGRSRKTRRHRGRFTVGEKGLGRLAALRLGQSVVLTTRPRGTGEEHTLVLDWSLFDTAGVVEDVALDITTAATADPPGTDLRLTGLRRALTDTHQKSLARSLLLLGDPFGEQGDFEAVLQTEEFDDLAALIRGSYLAAADFRLSASVDQRGRASATLFGPNGETLDTADHLGLAGDSSPYRCPAAALDMYVFRLGGPAGTTQNLQLRQVGIGKVREWLRAVGGVHLYHRGLRVRPFGDPGYDWLQLDVRRARSPEDRPSTNTTVGRVTVDDEAEALLPKTDRLGFVENEAFSELVRFGVDATEFMARWRTEDSRQRRIAAKRAAKSRLDRARAGLAAAVDSLPGPERTQLQDAVRKFDEATERRDEQRLRDVQLYRTLSTIGAATSVVAHESDKPTERLVSLLASARKRVERELGGKLGPKLAEPFAELDKVSEGLRAVAKMPLRLLRADRRRTADTSVGDAVHEAMTTFGYFLDQAGVAVIEDYVDGDIVKAAPAALEVIAANMIVNALAAFYGDKRAGHDRRLQANTTVDDGHVTLEISDNGPGFQRISADDVWKLGETRREGGSGLGLTIVRDTVTDLGGSAEAVSPGTLGGATFIVRLPRPIKPT